MKHNPLVSIVTPVLNGIRYLEANLQNVLDQSYPHIEHILIDGGSTDGSLEVLERYQAKHPDKIKFLAGTDNGVGEANNKGFMIAKGEILGWLDSDDFLEPDAIKTIVDFFRANPDAHFVFGAGNIVDENNQIIGHTGMVDFTIKGILRNKCYIPFESAYYKKEVVESIGYLNPLGNSLDFWLKIAEKYDIHRIEQTIANNRLQRDGVFFSPGARQTRVRRQRYWEDYVICRRYGESIFSPRCRKYIIYRVVDVLGLYTPLAFTLERMRLKYPLVNKVMAILGLSGWQGRVSRKK